MKKDYAATSRRMSMVGYKRVNDKIEERKAEEFANLQKEQAAESERKLQAIEEEKQQDQLKINETVGTVNDSYDRMVSEGKAFQKNESDLNEKLKEEEMMHATSEEVYKTKDIDDTASFKMHIRRLAYRILPVLDCFFAFFAILPILTSKFVETRLLDEHTTVVIGAVLAILVGYGLSIVSRLAVSSIDEDNDSFDSMRVLKKLAVGGSMLALPLMYVIGEITYGGSENWAFSGGFAFMSLIIQMLIVSGFKKHMEALEYFKTKAYNERAKADFEHDKNAIKSEKEKIKADGEVIIANFREAYNTFTTSFRELAFAIQEYQKKYNIDPYYNLNQLVLYIGNLICFRREVIKLHRDGGYVSSMSTIDFPNVMGGEQFRVNNDLVYLDYMIKYTGSGISLSETINRIEEQRNRIHTSGTDHTAYNTGAITLDSQDIISDNDGNGQAAPSDGDVDENDGSAPAGTII